MMRLLASVLIAAIALCVSCSGEDSEKCGFSGQTTLSDPERAAWPKFARDHGNTGRIEGVVIEAEPNVRWVFPPSDQPALQPISTSALVGSDGNIRFVGVTTDNDVKLYVLDAATGAVLNKITPTPAPTPQASPTEDAPTVASGTSITSTPLLAADGTIFIATTAGNIGHFEEDEETALVVSSLGGLISASPTIAADGTIYVGSLAGSFGAVCPNGIPRFLFAAGASQSSPAIIEGATISDRRIFFAGDNAQVRTVDYSGRQSWIFFAAAAVRGAVVIDQREIESGTADRLYVADDAGWVFAVHLTDGAAIWGLRPGGGAAISASPALGSEHVYIADEQGGFYALDPTTGDTIWTCRAEGPIRSSPAVASSAAGEVIVFGADDAKVYAVDAARAEGCTESCNCGDVALWTVPVDAPVGRSSPSIGFDGSIYIGTEGGHLYAIGPPPIGVATGTPTSTATPLITATGDR